MTRALISGLLWYHGLQVWDTTDQASMADALSMR